MQKIAITGPTSTAKLRVNQTGAGPANDDTMADGSDKLKLFFARFYHPPPPCPANRNAPTSFSRATLGIVFFLQETLWFDNSKCASASIRIRMQTLTHTHYHSHTHTFTHSCVLRVGAFFKYFYALSHTTLCSALLPLNVFNIFAFSHFAFSILGATENSASFFEFLRNLPQSIQIFLLLLLLLLQLRPCRNIFDGLRSSGIVKITTLPYDNTLYSVRKCTDKYCNICTYLLYFGWHKLRYFLIRKDIIQTTAPAQMPYPIPYTLPLYSYLYLLI